MTRSNLSENCIFSMLITWTQIYASPNLHKAIKAEISSLIASSVASPKFWEGPNILNLNEQHYFVLDTASQSSKRQDMLELEIWGTWPLGPPALRLCWFFERLQRVYNFQLSFSNEFLLRSAHHCYMRASREWNYISKYVDRVSNRKMVWGL